VLNDEQDLERLSQLSNTEYAGGEPTEEGFPSGVKTTLAGNPLVTFAKEHKKEVLAH
jgi:hypothetical protein